MRAAPLDPQVAGLMATQPVRSGDGPPPDPDVVRAESARRPTSRLAGPDVREVTDFDVDLGDRSVRARHYLGDRDDCVVVFLHGGGFVTGDLDSQDAQARMVCAETARSVVSIAYRLAPEHRFPAAYDDAVASVRWVHAHGADLVGTSSAPAVACAGPSAGANLAVGAALALAGTSAQPTALLLAYPMVSGDPSFPSRTEHAEAPGLTSQVVEWTIGAYLDESSARLDPRFAPLHSPHLDRLPPTVVVTAGHDPLRDEGRAFAEKLRAASVDVRALEDPTLPHGFWKLAPAADAAHATSSTMCSMFRDAIEAGSP